MTTPTPAKSNDPHQNLWGFTLDSEKIREMINAHIAVYENNTSEENRYRLMSAVYTYLNSPVRVWLSLVKPDLASDLWDLLQSHSLEVVQPLLAEYGKLHAESTTRAQVKAFHSRLEMLYAYLGMLWKHKDKFERTAQHEILKALDAVEPILTARAKALITQLNLSESELMVMAREARRLLLGGSTLFVLEKLTEKIKKEMPHTSATTHTRLAVLIYDKPEMWRGIKRMWRMSPRPWLAIVKASLNLMLNLLRWRL